MAKRERYRLLDEIRALTLFSMIAYHTMWDLVYMFGVAAPWYSSGFGIFWMRSIGITFVLLSGFCFSLGRHHLRRGAFVFLCGAIVSAVTLLVMYENRIIFGVLTLLGSCMLITIPLQKLLRKANCYAGLAVSLLLWLLTFDIRLGYIGLFGFKFFELPDALYSNYFTTYLGFVHQGFYSTDYYPIIPWYFLFVAGFFLHAVFKRHGLLEKLPNPKIPPLEFIGRHTIVIYMLHQPIIFGALYVLNLIFGFS